MSTISWLTPKGSLGTVNESIFFQCQLSAVDSDSNELFYSLISGDLPGGMNVTRSGEIRGIPSISSATLQTLTYSFTVRASNLDGVIADRSFSITVSNVSGPYISPRPDLIGAWFDGSLVDYNFNVINDNSSATATWSIISGGLPPNLTLSPDGRLFGYLDLIAANNTELGFEAGGIDALVLDVPEKSRDKYYNFIIQVTDGNKFDTLICRLLVVSKGSYTADNVITIINNTFISVDADNQYRPSIVNIPDTTTTINYGSGGDPLYTITTTYEYPTLVAGDTFAYKLIAYDPEDAAVSWRIDEYEFSGMDELDAGRQANVYFGNDTIGPYGLARPAENIDELVIRINNDLIHANVDYVLNPSKNILFFTNVAISSIERISNNVRATVSSHSFVEGDTVNIINVTDNSFNGAYTVSATNTGNVYFNQIGSNATSSGGILARYAPGPEDDIDIRYIDTGSYPIGTGFDTILFDQGVEGLPTGIEINRKTGWLFGTLPSQVEDEKIYNLNIKAYRTDNPILESPTSTFSFKVKRTRNETITWNSPTFLGTIDNGGISELQLSAANNLGKELEYSLTYNPYKKVPQGLKLLPSGRFIGRATFRYFSLDGSIGYLNLDSTENIEVGMSVQGVGISAGCQVTAIIDNHEIEVRPAIFAQQGAILTFSNESINTVASTTTNAISTTIDGGGTTFDQDCYFTAKAEAIDGSISSTKNFKIKVIPRNLAPYENLWLKSLPNETQRTKYKDLINDETLLPPSLIYRPDDPYFGVSKSLKILFLSGLSAAQISAYTTALERNHYTKTINFGEIKTARAIDSNGNVKYEVVYVDAIDPQQYDTPGPSLEKTLSVTNNYLYNGNEYNVIYPNSFTNMQYRIDEAIGYTNRGALPTWMTSVQENGLVLGLTRAVVIAYTQPGASKLIKYRLENSTKWPDGNFSFVADRYQWENFLSKFYNVATASFTTSRETTFDKYTTLNRESDVVYTAISQAVNDSYSIRVGDNLTLGAGWIVKSTDPTSEIPANTYITNISGNLITLSEAVSSDPSAPIKIDGGAVADYAVTTTFVRINGKTYSHLIENDLIDGMPKFVNNETIVFYNQGGNGDDGVNYGWEYTDGSTVPGYLEKLAQVSSINYRSSLWTMSFADIEIYGFDNSSYGFDQEAPGLLNSYFDQGDESEIQLVFKKEVIPNQTVKVRSGKTFPTTTMQYKLLPGNAIPEYVPSTEPTRTRETTFDGGSCICREGDPRGGIRGGTGFQTNRDKYEVPESLDKYIKFPQDGVFV